MTDPSNLEQSRQGEAVDLPTHVAEMFQFSLKTQQQLGDMWGRFNLYDTAIEVWNDVLTEGDRQLLGNDLETAWRTYGCTTGLVSKIWNCPPQHAIVRLCEAFQSYDPVTRARLGREVGLAPTVAHSYVPLKPQWNKNASKIFYDGKIARTIRSIKVAWQIVKILDAFEEDSWPERIDDPLSSAKKTVARKDSQRLRETIASLNSGIELIQFSADGTGEGIRWEPK